MTEVLAPGSWLSTHVPNSTLHGAPRRSNTSNRGWRGPSESPHRERMGSSSRCLALWCDAVACRLSERLGCQVYIERGLSSVIHRVNLHALNVPTSSANEAVQNEVYPPFRCCGHRGSSPISSMGPVWWPRMDWRHNLCLWIPLRVQQ